MTSLRMVFRFAACAIVLAGCAVVASAETRYGITKLPTAIDVNDFYENYYIEPMAINSNKQVVGHVRGTVRTWVPDYGGYWDFVEVQRAFTWSPGMSQIRTVHPTTQLGYATHVTALNDHGIATVSRETGDGFYDAAPALWNTANDQFTNLVIPTGQGSIATPTAISDTGHVVSDDLFRTVHWDAAGNPTPYFPHNSPNDPTHGGAKDINNLGVMVGHGFFNVTNDRDGNGDGRMELPFVCNTATGQVNALPIMYRTNDPADPMYTAKYDGDAKCINDNGLIGGSSNMPRARYPYERLGAPCYWEADGTLNDLRDVLPWEDNFSSYGYIYGGQVLDIGDDDTMLIDAYGTRSSSWLYNPGTDVDARYLADLVTTSDETWQSYYARAMADDGSIIGTARGPHDTFGSYDYNLLFLPYEVQATPITAGTNQQVDLNGGLGAIGGAEATFSDVTDATVVSHYGTGDISNFAVTFLADPADMGDVASLLLTGDAQYWSVEVEDGSYTGPITLTFQYDPTLLPAGTNPGDLVVLHYGDAGWETLTPIAVDAINHTITVQTDSLSPFMLGQVPQPASICVMIVGTLYLKRRHA